MKAWIFVILSLLFVVSFQRAYDHNLARELLRASTASYCSASSLQSWKCGASCNDLKGYTFNHNLLSSISSSESISYSVFLNHANHRVVFAFRGTQGKLQLMKEAAQSRAITYDLHKISNAVATEYFFLKYKNNLRNDFLGRIRQLVKQYPDYSYFFTGHSLGGALTTHAALDVALLNIVDKERIHLYTFGCPRVGDYNLAQAVNNHIGETYRVVHAHDIVPHLPPCITDFKGGCTAYPNHPNQNGFIIWNAYHAGTEIFYDSPSASSYKTCSKLEDPTCSKKYGLLSLGTNDHLTYLGISTPCTA
jgi:hypothetical protein